jgi:ankyrin repeat protein
LGKHPDLVSASDSDGYTAIQHASLIYGASEEGEAVMDYLIAKRSPVDILTASHFGMRGIVVDLLDSDPTLARTQDKDGYQPLHWVCRIRRAPKNHFIAMTEKLIELNADVNAVEQACGQWMPLHVAAEWAAYTEQADLLLDAGADLNGKTPYGWTPLDFSLDLNRKEMISFLRKKGAVEGSRT